MKRDQIKAIMAKHGVSNATPAQLNAMIVFEAKQQSIKESKNNIPCVTCGNRNRTKRGDFCFKCANNKHLVNAHHTAMSNLKR